MQPQENALDEAMQAYQDGLRRYLIGHSTLANEMAMSTEHPPEPTRDQCMTGGRVEDFKGCPAFACWYPQMGGYVGRCVVVLIEGCVDCYIWHDGAFPFSGDSGSTENPVCLHHCDVGQFIGFGHLVLNFHKTAYPDKPSEETKP